MVHLLQPLVTPPRHARLPTLRLWRTITDPSVYTLHLFPLPFFYFNCPYRGRELLPNSPISSKIPSPNQNRLPSNIPLRTLNIHPEQLHGAQSTSLLPGARGPSSNDRLSSDSADSGFDSWTDTGDIAEQFADEEDPLAIRLADTSVNDGLLAGVGEKKRNKHKRVQFRRSVSEHSQRQSQLHPGVVDKEAIEIPDVPLQRPSRAARLLSVVMPGTGLRGLTGKGLMYAETLNSDTDTSLI